MKKADVIIVSLALTKETEGMISREHIGMMQKTAYVVSIAGMSLFDEDALKDGLTGEKKSSYQAIFAGYPTIERAEVVFRPPWSRTFPSRASKIKIEQILDF